MEKINKPEMREYCENCEYLSQKEKYGEGIYPCRKCDNKRLTDFFNSSHKKWESFYNQEIKKKNKEILESRNKVKMLKGMAAELSGCYDMDTKILHREILEFREEIKRLNIEIIFDLGGILKRDPRSSKVEELMSKYKEGE